MFSLLIKRNASNDVTVKNRTHESFTLASTSTRGQHRVEGFWQQQTNIDDGGGGGGSWWHRLKKEAEASVCPRARAKPHHTDAFCFLSTALVWAVNLSPSLKCLSRVVVSVSCHTTRWTRQSTDTGLHLLLYLRLNIHVPLLYKHLIGS